MIPGDPLPTAEGDLPYEFLNRVSAACAEVELLERAHVGWLAPWPEVGSSAPPGARLTLVLGYRRQPTVTRFPWRPFTGDLVFVDDGEVRVAPDLDVIHARIADLGPEIEACWLRVF